MSDDARGGVARPGRFQRLWKPAGPARMPATEVLVIGLGRFGSALARTLVEMGHDVLGVDSDGRLVQQLAADLTQTVQADTTDVETLRQLGAADFGRAVVAIGNDVEASILTVAGLVDVGVDRIWAKAVTQAHAKILQRVGAHHVVLPESEMGKRVAHLVVGGRMLDYVALDENFAIVETAAPKALVGSTLLAADVRRRYGVTVVCVKPEGGKFTYTTADTVIGAGDLLVVAGPTRATEAFAELP